MFFVDPATAVRETLRVVLKDGRVVLPYGVQRRLILFFSSITDVIDQFLEVHHRTPMRLMHFDLPFR